MPDYQLAVVRDGQAQWDSAAVIDAPRLTPRQRAVFACLRAHIDTYGYAPTLEHIGDTVGLASRSSVAYQLDQLEAKGMVRRRAHRIRGVRISDRLPARTRHGELYVIPGGAP